MTRACPPSTPKWALWASCRRRPGPRRAQLALQAPRAQRLHRGVGGNLRGVQEKHLALNQTPLLAELDHPDEELLVDLDPEAPPGLAQHAVVGNRLVQFVTQKPAPGQVETGLPARPPLAHHPE